MRDFDDKRYRFHLAKTEPKGGRPIDALAKSKKEWLGWQVYRGKAKERFIANYIVSFAQISGNKFLFGGVLLIATLYWLKFFDYFKLILLFLLYFEQNYWSRCSHNWVFKGMGRTA